MSASLERRPPHCHAAWEGEERSNVSRSAVESGEAARDEASSAVAGAGLSPRRSAVAFTAANAAAETGTDERPLIAVSAGSFNTTPPEEGNQNKKEFLMKAFSFLLACCAALLAAGSASASDASPDADMALQLRRILKEHPDIVLDVLREHSETALDIVQLGADRRRAEALHNQWTEDARQPKKASLEERP